MHHNVTIPQKNYFEKIRNKSKLAHKRKKETEKNSL